MKLDKPIAALGISAEEITKVIEMMRTPDTIMSLGGAMSGINYTIGYLEGLRDGVGNEDEARYQSLLGLFAREVGPDVFNSDELQAEIRAI